MRRTRWGLFAGTLFTLGSKAKGKPPFVNSAPSFDTNLFPQSRYLNQMLPNGQVERVTMMYLKCPGPLKNWAMALNFACMTPLNLFRIMKTLDCDLERNKSSNGNEVSAV